MAAGSRRCASVIWEKAANEEKVEGDKLGMQCRHNRGSVAHEKKMLLLVTPLRLCLWVL